MQDFRVKATEFISRQHQTFFVQPICQVKYLLMLVVHFTYVHARYESSNTHNSHGILCGQDFLKELEEAKSEIDDLRRIVNTFWVSFLINAILSTAGLFFTYPIYFFIKKCSFISRVNSTLKWLHTHRSFPGLPYPGDDISPYVSLDIGDRC